MAGLGQSSRVHRAFWPSATPTHRRIDPFTGADRSCAGRRSVRLRKGPPDAPQVQERAVAREAIALVGRALRWTGSGLISATMTASTSATAPSAGSVTTTAAAVRVISVARTPWGTRLGVRVDRIGSTDEGIDLEGLIALSLATAGTHPIVLRLPGGFVAPMPDVCHDPFGPPPDGLPWLVERDPHALVIACEDRGDKASAGTPGTVDESAAAARARSASSWATSVPMAGRCTRSVPRWVAASPWPWRARRRGSARWSATTSMRTGGLGGETDKDPPYGIQTARTRRALVPTLPGGKPAERARAYAARCPTCPSRASPRRSFVFSARAIGLSSGKRRERSRTASAPPPRPFASSSTRAASALATRCPTRRSPAPRSSPGSDARVDREPTGRPPR